MEIFESLLAGLRTVCADFPDARRSPDPKVDYSMADIGLSAFLSERHLDPNPLQGLSARKTCAAAEAGDLLGARTVNHDCFVD